jgi:peptidoglycan/LPS O-acetylase OafA/YrhL
MALELTAPDAAAKQPKGAGVAEFSMRDSDALKGLAILAIAFHNFFHRVPHIVGENEFDFDPARFSLFHEQLLMPATTVQALFSFFGHYGVGIFVTLSCYGLAQSSTSGNHNGAWGFLKSRLRKILPMTVVCMSVWLVLQLRTHALADLQYWSATLGELVLLCIGLFNVLPGLAMPAVGPWWFIPFILQLYLLWAFVGRTAMALSTPVLLSLTVAIHALVHWVNPMTTLTYQINLLETPVGHVPEIALGILLLRFRTSRLGAWLPPLLVVLVIGNASPHVWPLAPVAATLIVLIVYGQLRRFGAAPGWLAWIGALSLPIFMLNGFVRRPFLAMAQASGIAGADLVLGIVSVACSIAAAALLTQVMHRVTTSRTGRRQLAG